MFILVDAFKVNNMNSYSGFSYDSNSGVHLLFQTQYFNFLAYIALIIAFSSYVVVNSKRAQHVGNGIIRELTINQPESKLQRGKENLPVFWFIHM